METRYTDCDELISLQTDRVSLTVKGRVPFPDAQNAEQASSLAVECGGPYQLRVCGRLLSPPREGDAPSACFRTRPLLGADGRVEIVVEALDGGAPSFRHPDRRVESRVTASGRSGRVLSGAVDFSGSIGLSEMTVLLDSEAHLRLTVEVFPSSLSYREEYKALSAGAAREASRFLRELPGELEEGPRDPADENAGEPPFSDGSSDLTVRDLPLLYERWCFLKLNNLILDGGQYIPVFQDAAVPSKGGLSVFLTPDRPACVRYRNRETEERLALFWHPRECDTPTGAQRPRCVLSLEKKGAAAPYEYVFEPSYRFNPALPGTEYRASVSPSPGPETADIQQLHRYRDAIVCGNGASSYERTVFGAYVLFPYACEEAYREHRFFASIGRVNVGGLPFLPGAVSLTAELLGQLIADSPASAMERAALPRGLEGKLAKVNWSVRDVLIGTLRNPEQLAVCLKHRLYYIPAERLADSDFPIRYVAIYQSRKLFGDEAGIRYFGEVTKCIPVRRAEIRESPCRPGTEDKLYYRFEIKQWRRRSRPIAAKEAGFVRSFTNLFLLEHSAELPELWIRSAEEYRLYCELKRAVRDACIDGEDGAPGFRFGSFSLLLDDRKIYLVRGSRVLADFRLSDFSRRPGEVFRLMLRECARHEERPR